MTIISVYDGVTVKLIDTTTNGNSIYEPALDYLYLGGMKSPGLATVKSVNSPRGWDKREGYGVSGASTIYHGAKLANVEVEFFLWTDDHWLAWNNEFSKVLLPPRTGAATYDGFTLYTDPKTGVVSRVATGVTQSAGTVTGLGIYHPQISNPPIGISSVVVEDVSGFEQGEEGGWTCTVKFLEFRPPMQALSKPNQAIPSIEKPAPVAKDAADVELQQKFAELAAVAKGK